MGYKGSKSGSCWQGECPTHGSSSGKCLVIWPGIQAFKCYHCGASGDVIDLVMLYKRCDHPTAVQFLADRVGMPISPSTKRLSPEEQNRYDADKREEQLVYSMLTEAAEWYHQQLQSYPGIIDHLLKHYGFSQKIIDELRIGFAPPKDKPARWKL